MLISGVRALKFIGARKVKVGGWVQLWLFPVKFHKFMVSGQNGYYHGTSREVERESLRSYQTAHTRVKRRTWSLCTHLILDPYVSYNCVVMLMECKDIIEMYGVITGTCISMLKVPALSEIKKTLSLAWYHQGCMISTFTMYPLPGKVHPPFN